MGRSSVAPCDAPTVATRQDKTRQDKTRHLLLRLFIQIQIQDADANSKSLPDLQTAREPDLDLEMT
jgi:hypothetical protein